MSSSKRAVLIYFISFAILASIAPKISCFSFFNDIFEDLRIGSIDKSYITDKITGSRSKCLDGSHFFNGSCYFISNKKYRESEFQLDEWAPLLNLNKERKRNRNYLPGFLEQSSLNNKIVKASLKDEYTWESANQNCTKLNNDSTLVYPESSEELKFLIEILMKLNFEDISESFKEEKYHIGLRFRNLTWRWVNGKQIDDETAEILELKSTINKEDEYNFRQCASLIIRNNRKIKVELVNCNSGTEKYVCKYVHDRCYNNTSCGKNGECINLPSLRTFECKCRIFYDGKNCEKWSTQGVQMLISVCLVGFGFLIVIVIKCANLFNLRWQKNILKQRKKYLSENDKTTEFNRWSKRKQSVIGLPMNCFHLFVNYLKKKRKLAILITTCLSLSLLLMFLVSFLRYKMIELRIEIFKNKVSPYLNPLLANSSYSNISSEFQKNKREASEKYNEIISNFTRIFSFDICPKVTDAFFEEYFSFAIALPLTIFIYIWNSFKCRCTKNCGCGLIGHKKRKIVKKNNDMDDSEDQNCFTRKISKKLKKDPAKSNKQYRSVWRYFGSIIGLNKLRRCKIFCCICNCGLEFPVPMNPFSKRNRFLTAVIYAAYTYNILKIFEYLLIGEQNFKAVSDARSNFIHAKDFLKNVTANNSFNHHLVVNKSKEIFYDAKNKLENARTYIERGILLDLIKQVCNVFIIGLKYYPVLLCFELKRKSKLCFFLCTLYVWILFIHYLFTNAFCLLSISNTIKDVNDRSHSNPIYNSFASISDFKSDQKNSNEMNFDHPVNFIVGARNIILNQTNSSIDFQNTSDSTSTTATTTTKTITLNLVRFRRDDSGFETQQLNNYTNNFDQTIEELAKLKSTLFKSNIMYEKFLFYAVICLITINTTLEFIYLAINAIRSYRKRKNAEKSKLEGPIKEDAVEKKSLTLNRSDYGIDQNNNNPVYVNLNPNEEPFDDEFMIRDYNQNEIIGVVTKNKGNLDLAVERFQADSDLDDYDDDGKKINHELNYARALYNLHRVKQKPKSFLRHLIEKYIYKPKKDFRYSKQFINTHIIAFILLYYLTSIIIRKSTLIMNLSSNFLILLINYIFKSSSASEANSFINNSKTQLNIIVKSLFSHITIDIVVACSLTTSIYVIQLLLGIRNYQKQVLNAYKGVYVDIPSPKRFSNAKLTSSSLHYSGYAIGYLLWGYLILFEITIVIVVLIRFLIAFYIIAENIAKIVLPVLTIFMFKRILIWYLSRYFLTSRSSKNLKNRKLYFILNHFNFFFDCFLGSFVCFVRVIKSGLAALFFMPRLDYSIFGRYLERTDMGFISYVTFIHMEVNQTHPVKLAFCKLLQTAIKKNQYHHLNRNRQNEDNDEENLSALSVYNSNRIRNKWQVAYTLLKYPFLKKQRKRYLDFQGYVPKVETFEKFLQRHAKGVFTTPKEANNKNLKMISQSTPSLNALDLNMPNSGSSSLYRKKKTMDNFNNQNKTSTLNKQLATNEDQSTFNNNTHFTNDY